MDSHHSSPSGSAPQAQRTPPQQPPVPSTALLQGHKAVNISHNGMLYTLQTTKLGKLILTK